MSRCVIEKSEQKRFLAEVCKVLGLSTASSVAGISDRVLRAWRQARLTMSYDSVRALCKAAGLALPKIIEIKPDHWHMKDIAATGGMARCRLHGNPGTARGRRLGGIISQEKFRRDPDYAMGVGVKVRKRIITPPNCDLLAEFVGIVLGDGGITDRQVRITFNRTFDRRHALFIKKTIFRLFGLSAAVVPKKCSNADDIIISSSSLVDFLVNKGLKPGSKIRNAIGVPQWIFGKASYKRSVLRGLVDTDGSFYAYSHTVNGRRYRHFSMCFTSYSRKVLDSVYEILISQGFGPCKGRDRVYLHKKMDIARYFDIIGSHNPKHVDKFDKYRLAER